MPRWRVLACLSCALLAAASGARGQTRALTIAAASDLQTVLPHIVSGFERATGTKAAVTFGSSGSFFAQIQNGAPYDLYFSADIDYPRRLGASGHADPATLYEYASGRIVLWTRNDSGIDITPGLRVVRDARVRRIAIANPAVAPYGRAAVAALQSGKLYDEAQPKLVHGDNIAQAAQLAASGNATVAILAHSLAAGPALAANGRFVEIPASAHPPLAQGAIVIGASRNRAAAERFLAYVKSAEAQAILRKFGFMTPATAR